MIHDYIWDTETKTSIYPAIIISPLTPNESKSSWP